MILVLFCDSIISGHEFDPISHGFIHSSYRRNSKTDSRSAFLKIRGRLSRMKVILMWPYFQNHLGSLPKLGTQALNEFIVSGFDYLIIPFKYQCTIMILSWVGLIPSLGNRFVKFFVSQVFNWKGSETVRIRIPANKRQLNLNNRDTDEYTHTLMHNITFHQTKESLVKTS